MWQRKSPVKTQSVTHHAFKPALRRYHNQSKSIRLTLDPRYTDQVGIQAISKIYRSNFPQISFRLFRINRFEYLQFRITSSTIGRINDQSLQPSYEKYQYRCSI